MRNYISVNKNSYNALAKEYQNRREEDYKKDLLTLRPFFDILGDKTANTFILDLGCGTGLNTKMFSDLNFNSIGVDNSEKMLEVAKKYDAKSLYICANFAKKIFTNDSFQYIFSKASLHNFPKKDALKVLENVKSWLKPGGIFYVSTTLSDSPKEGYYTKKDYKTKVKRFRKFWTLEELQDVLIKYGFKIVKTYLNEESDRRKTWLNIIAKK